MSHISPPSPPSGPSMMPGGSLEAYKIIEPIVSKVAAQVDDGPCVTYIGEGGAGNYVKMVHNGIEYGDMQVGERGRNWARRTWIAVLC